MSQSNLYNKGLFDDWVPKGWMLLLIILFLFPILTVSGVFTNNISELAGRFGSYTEHIQMANNAVTIGMALAMPILMRIKMRFRSKEVIVGSTLLLALLVYFCASTSNIYLYIGGNFLIGFVKMFPMLELVIPAMFILSPKGDKTRFYSLFYPLVIGASSLIGYYMSSYAFDYGMSSVFYLNILAMLGIAALALIFMHNKRFSMKYPLYQVDWISLVSMAISMLSLSYGLTFLKQQNWLNEPGIVASLLISIVLFAYVIFRQSGQKRKLYVFSEIIKHKSVQHGMVLLMFQALYLSGSSVFMQWTMGALGYNALVSAKLNLWMLPGLLIGGILGFVGFKKGWNIKYYILLGFGAFFLNTLLTYLMIQPNMNIEMLYLPTVLKGIGMVILFIAVWFYCTKDLAMPNGLGIISLMMVFRTAISVGITGGLLGYLTNQFQMQSLADMSNYWDSNLMGPEAMRTYGTAQIGALLAAGKTLLGYLCWMILPVSVIVLFHDYGHPNNRRRILIKKLLKGKSIQGYRISSAKS